VRSLLLPYERPVSQHLRKPKSLRLRLPSIEDRFHNVGREACERQQPADVGVRDALLLRKVSNRACLPTLDPAPPAVGAHERLDRSYPERTYESLAAEHAQPCSFLHCLVALMQPSPHGCPLPDLPVPGLHRPHRD
jgi:hypothetical protein